MNDWQHFRASVEVWTNGLFRAVEAVDLELGWRVATHETLAACGMDWALANGLAHWGRHSRRKKEGYWRARTHHYVGEDGAKE